MIRTSLAAASLCLMMTGCSQPQNQSGTAAVIPQETAEPGPADNTVQSSYETDEKEIRAEDLKLTEFGYSISRSGYLHYAAQIENPNKDCSPRFACLQITGRNPDGSIGFHDEQTIGFLPADASTWYADQAGNGNVTEDMEITAKVSVEPEDWQHSSPFKAPWKVENVNASQNSAAETTITGEITLLSMEETDAYSIQKPMLTAVFKNGEGKPIGGTSTFLRSSLPLNEAVPFEINVYGIDSTGCTVEVTASPGI